MKIEPPPMYRREAWAASMLGRCAPRKAAAGPGPLTTAAVCAVGIVIALALLYALGFHGRPGAP